MSALLEYLIKRKDDRGLMAMLRCALVESKRHRAWPILGRFGAIGNTHDALTLQYIGGLFAIHPENSDNVGNIGNTCLQLCRQDEKPDKDEKPGPMAKRLQWLLASEREEIGERILRIIQMARSKGYPVNYSQLEKDLKYWGDRVKMEWAAAFWAPGAPKPEVDQ